MEVFRPSEDAGGKMPQPFRCRPHIPPVGEKFSGGGRQIGQALLWPFLSVRGLYVRSCVRVFGLYVRSGVR